MAITAKNLPPKPFTEIKWLRLVTYYNLRASAEEWNETGLIFTDLRDFPFFLLFEFLFSFTKTITLLPRANFFFLKIFLIPLNVILSWLLPFRLVDIVNDNSSLHLSTLCYLYKNV